MNRDIEQIKLFLDSTLRHGTAHGWQESSEGVDAEKAYIRITSYGENKGFVNDLQKLNDLLNAKKNRDLHKKGWTDMLLHGWLGVEELIEDGCEDIAKNCMKDIVKTTSRIELMQRAEDREMGGDYCLPISFANRNWFMDLLNVKLPADHACQYKCYICMEEFWAHGQYVKI